MVGHVQSVRTRGRQRDRGLTVQQAAGRRGNVLIDRVVHELMPEHDAVAGLVEQLGVERVVELRDDLGRRPVGDGGDVAERHGIAEHRGDLQQLQRPRGQVPQAANHQGTKRCRQLRGGRLDAVAGSAQHAFVGQRAQHGHGPQRVPAGLGQQGGQRGTGRRPEHVTGERGQIVRRQRSELQRARSPGREIVEQPDRLGRQRRRPSRRHDEQRRQRQLPCHRRDGQQARAVGPVDVLGDQQHRSLRARRLHQVHDLLDDLVLDVAGGRRRRRSALAGQQGADRCPARVR
jgi:hypothetical protein